VALAITGGLHDVSELHGAELGQDVLPVNGGVHVGPENHRSLAECTLACGDRPASGLAHRGRVPGGGLACLAQHMAGVGNRASALGQEYSGSAAAAVGRCLACPRLAREQPICTSETSFIRAFGNPSVHFRSE
jgi:hypothetical protein